MQVGTQCFHAFPSADVFPSLSQVAVGREWMKRHRRLVTLRLRIVTALKHSTNKTGHDEKQYTICKVRKFCYSRSFSEGCYFRWWPEWLFSVRLSVCLCICVSGLSWLHLWTDLLTVFFKRKGIGSSCALDSMTLPVSCPPFPPGAKTPPKTALNWPRSYDFIYNRIWTSKGSLELD